MTEQAPTSAAPLTEEEELKICAVVAANAKMYHGYTAQGTGLHNSYCRDVPRLLATITQLRQELAEARGWRTLADQFKQQALDRADREQLRAEAAEKRAVEAEAALKPFAEMAAHYPANRELPGRPFRLEDAIIRLEDKMGAHEITVGDLRRAKSALTKP